MFWKKDKEETDDKYEVLKLALKMALRRIAGTEIKKTKEGQILALICESVRSAESGDLYDEAVAKVMDQFSDEFEKDPMLKQDIIDILTLMGLGDINVDVEKVDAVLDTVCLMVS